MTAHLAALSLLSTAALPMASPWSGQIEIERGNELSAGEGGWQQGGAEPAVHSGAADGQPVRTTVCVCGGGGGGGGGRLLFSQD